MTIAEAHFILYVRDQGRSTAFFSSVLGLTPVLNVPGMTQFELPGGAILGLMPESGALRLLGDEVLGPTGARAEMYLVVEDAAAFHARAIANGAQELSPVIDRDWGHRAGYSADPDGHVLAFAEVVDQA